MTVTGFLATHLEILQRKDVIGNITELLTKKNTERRGSESMREEIVGDGQTMVF
jgi:hypothetical protein